MMPIQTGNYSPIEFHNAEHFEQMQLPMSITKTQGQDFSRHCCYDAQPIVSAVMPDCFKEYFNDLRASPVSL
jgi:hypothetical protein